MKTAIVHDYLVHIRGGERVFQTLCEMYPDADAYSLVYNARAMPLSFRPRQVHTSFVQALPGAARPQFFRIYLPLYPFAAALLATRHYDLVISNSSAWVQGVPHGDGAFHICNCLSPFRYAWSHYDDLIKARLARRLFLAPLLAGFRRWDVGISQRVDAYIAISEVVRWRIAEYYARDSIVIHPPVDLAQYHVSKVVDDFYLVVSALVQYKRVDVAIRAFNLLKLPLIVVGDGPERARLESIAGPTIRFTGQLHDSEVADLYSRCQALVFPSLEDYGIVPLEAMASGRPVVAYGAGGALETVVDGLTGRFFANQTPQDLADAVMWMQVNEFDPEAIRSHAAKFDVSAYKERFAEAVDLVLLNKRHKNTGEW